MVLGVEQLRDTQWDVSIDIWISMDISIMANIPMQFWRTKETSSNNQISWNVRPPIGANDAPNYILVQHSC